MKDARLQVAFAGLHPDRVASLYEKYGPAGTLRRITSGSVKTTVRARSAATQPAETRRRQLHDAGIAVAYRGDDDYPKQLAEQPDAPDLLFVRGALPDVAGVAVVGTRRCTAYGRRIAAAYGRAIAKAGWPLISGLARGIDGAAHRGTVAGMGVGVAVLGSGIDVMYPNEHASLATELIAHGGAVISEAPPGTPPEAWRFPPRNRIISGLAGVVVVVEATVKGGALITAEAALRHGRQIFAVPGDITRTSSAGCNLLIRDGAFPVHDSDDLVESLELVLGPAAAKPASIAPPDLSPVETRVMELIGSGVQDLDSLLANDAGATGEVLAALGRLELAKIVINDGAGRFVAAGGR